MPEASTTVEPRRVESGIADRLRLTGNLRRKRLSENEGCEKCNGTGVLGRTVVGELVVPGAAMHAVIEEESASPEDLRAALPKDHRTLLDNVRTKVAEGAVSPTAAAAALGL